MPGQSETPANNPQDLLKRPRFILGEKRRQHYRDRIYREAEGKGRAPDYVGVGAQRAGTSRWHTLITAHPDVVDVTDPTGRIVKEIHWFDQPLAADTTDRDQATSRGSMRRRTRRLASSRLGICTTFGRSIAWPSLRPISRSSSSCETHSVVSFPRCSSTISVGSRSTGTPFENRSGAACTPINSTTCFNASHASRSLWAFTKLGQLARPKSLRACIDSLISMTRSCPMAWIAGSTDQPKLR